MYINCLWNRASTLTCPNLPSVACDQAANYQAPMASFTGACNNTGTLSGTVTSTNVTCNGGNLIVTYSGIDNCGNPISTTCNVQVTGTGPASITCPTLPSVSCDQAANYQAPAATFNGACNNTGTVNGAVTASNFDCGGGTLTVTYSGSDQCGNAISTTCNVVVTSGPAATVTCPNLPSVSCEQTTGYVVPAASYSGACNNNGSISGSVTGSNFDCSGGTLTVTYSGSDQCGNQIGTTCTVSVTGTGPAIITCPNLPSVSCDQVAGYQVPAASFSGGCNNNGTVSGSVTTTTVDCNGGSLIVTYSGSDQCGNAISTTCTVAVTGSGPAVITCPVLPSVACDQIANYQIPSATFNGACNNTGTLTGSISSNNFDCNGGLLVVTYSGTDQCGNPISTTCNATVTSGGPAVVTCPTITPVSCVSAANFVAPLATYTGPCNNNGSIGGTVTSMDFDCGGGTLTVTYNGTDQCNNTIGTTCSVIVTGSEPATITCPSLPTVACDQIGGIQIPTANFTGGCNNNGVASGMITSQNVDCNGGSITITYTALDNCGNTLSRDCAVTVTGTGPATISCPSLPSVACDQIAGYQVPAATFTGACNNTGTVAGSISSNNFDCNGGSLVVTYSGTDACGNAISTTCTATVTSGAPAVVSCPTLASVSCDQANGFTPPAASYTGACNNNGTVSGSVSNSNFDCNGGSLTITYAGFDQCGNSIGTTCNVIVTGGGAAIVTCPAFPSVACDQIGTFQVPAATYTGGCNNNGSISGIVSSQNVDCNGGSLVITYSGNDQCGNTIGTTCTVSVTGTGPAVITCPTLPSVACDQIASYIVPPASFSGACNNSGSVSGSVSNNNIDCNGGILMVTYSGTDNCGNAISTTCTATVTGGAPAVVTCPTVGAISCDAVPNFTVPAASYTGACNNNGSIGGTVTGNNFDCSGGFITLTYSGTDQCGNLVGTTCTVTVTGAGPATIECPVIPPVSCDQANTFPVPSASFSGGCNNFGTVAGTVTSVNADCSGGSISITYSGSDLCGNAISSVCTVAISGSGPAVVTCPNLPAISCENVESYLPPAATFNGACSNSGSISGSVTSSNFNCSGGSLIVTYNGTDQCGNAIGATCTVAVTGSGPVATTCPLQLTDITCEEAPTWIPPALVFSGACNNSGSLVGSVLSVNVGCDGGSIEVRYSGNDVCGNFIEQNCSFVVAPCNLQPDIMDQASICPGESFTWPVNGITYTSAPQVIEEMITDANGCIINATLILNALPKDPDLVDNVTVCFGEPFVWSVDNMTYTGNQIIRVPGAGCAADRVLNLMERNSNPPIMEEVEICQGEQFLWIDGMIYTTSGVRTFVAEDANGCDVMNILDLQVTPQGEDNEIEREICPGGSYFWSVTQITYTTAGVFESPLPGLCGGVDRLILTITPARADEIFVESICEGQEFFWPVNMMTYTQSARDTVEMEDPVTSCFFNAILDLTVTDGLTCTVNTTPTSCGNMGAASVSTTGGTGIYTYAWSNGDTGINTAGLPAGAISVTVTDSNGCTTICDGIVEGTDTPMCSTTSSDANCDTMGSATVSATGGSGGYTYLWSNGATTTIASGLAPGDYTVTVTDSNGCAVVCEATVGAGNAVVCDIVSTATRCGESNGTATVIATGGSGGYTYLWNNGATVPENVGLPAGIYSVVVTDSDGCSTSCFIEVEDSSSPTCTTTSTPAGCSVPDGSATVVPNGGTPPYSFVWSNGATSATAFGLVSGTYIVTVTDAVACSTTCQATVGSTGNAPVCSITVQDAACGEATGSADAVVTGGTPPFMYEWSNGETTQSIDNLPAGPYVVTVTDAAGCMSVCATMVNSIGGPSCQVVVTDAECGANNGMVTAVPSGGTGVFSYEWSTGATTPTIDDLAPGMYTVTVTDNKGCQVVCTAMVFTGGNTCAEIGDRVWNDADGDGRQDPSESGIPNVTVNLFNATTGEFVRSTITNAVGEYCFTGLPAGDYYVQFESTALTNFIPTQQIFNNGIDSKVSGAFGMNTTDAITVISGERNKTIDAGFYRGGRIGNTVFLDDTTNIATEGIIDSGDGRLEGVVVCLYEVEFGSEDLVACDTTDVNGNYLFSDLPLGNYFVEFTVPNSDNSLCFVSPDVGGDDTEDSDVRDGIFTDPSLNALVGRSNILTLGVGENNQNVDAGVTTRKVLDIQLLSFDGYWNEDRAMSELFWATATEVNSDFISVERADDLRFDFVELGALKAAGNSSVTTHYEFDDETITENGTYYYRLKLVDLDGSFEYSQPISIVAEFPEGRQQVDFAVYPNPVIETLNVELSVERPSQVEGGIYDVIGQLIQPLEITDLTAGKNVLEVKVDDIPVGTYLLRIQVDEQVLFEKVSIID